ncbi:MAG TPA: hypothetical protein VMR44_05480 [Thermoanaerobaculia bacterium]|nr:hypothetical protein [Thermoanaerobaculia bacterium]
MRSYRTWTAVACAAALLGVSGAAVAQEAAEARPALSYQEQVDAFFARLAAGESGEAIDDLYAGHPQMEALADQVGLLREQLTGLSERVGAHLGSERLAEERISERFVYLWYLAYFENQPLQFHFSFYRPKDRWTVFQLAYDEALTTLAKERAKARVAHGDPE